jgi:hypothetical protein
MNRVPLAALPLPTDWVKASRDLGLRALDGSARDAMLHALAEAVVGGPPLVHAEPEALATLLAAAVRSAGVDDVAVWVRDDAAADRLAPLRVAVEPPVDVTVATMPDDAVAAVAVGGTLARAFLPARSTDAEAIVRWVGEREAAPREVRLARTFADWMEAEGHGRAVLLTASDTAAHAIAAALHAEGVDATPWCDPDHPRRSAFQGQLRYGDVAVLVLGPAVSVAAIGGRVAVARLADVVSGERCDAVLVEDDGEWPQPWSVARRLEAVVEPLPEAPSRWRAVAQAVLARADAEDVVAHALRALAREQRRSALAASAASGLIPQEDLSVTAATDRPRRRGRP